MDQRISRTRGSDSGQRVRPGQTTGESAFRLHVSGNGAVRAATIGIFVIALVAGLGYAQPIAMPAALALVFGIVLTPLLTWTARHGVPRWLSALLLVTAFVGALLFAIILLAEPVRDWIEKAPEMGPVLREKLHFLNRPIAAFNTLRESIAGSTKNDGSELGIDLYAMLVRPVLGALTPAIGQMVVFFATLFFFLAGWENLRRRFLTLWSDRKARLDALHVLADVESSLASYFAAIAAINLVIGLLLALITLFAGIPNPLAWGILGFLLNFLPYIGPAVTIVMLLGASLIMFDSMIHILAAPSLFLVATVIEGQFVTPGLVGLRLALSPLLVFLAVAFWAWFWGPFGALVAVPLLVIGNVAFHHLNPENGAKLPD